MTVTAQCGRGEVFSCSIKIEVVHATLIVQTYRQVSACLEVGMDFQGRPQCRYIVIIDREAFRHTPQITAPVILIDGQNLPAVFIDIESTT